MHKYVLSLFSLLSFVTFGQTLIQTGTNISIAQGTTLTINETTPQNLTLQTNTEVVNNGTIVLGTQVTLNEPSRNTIGGTGLITATRNINTALNTYNFAGLGLSLTTAKILGQTTISRGHTIQFGNNQQSIKRYYEVLAANDSLTNFIVNYNDSTELNTLNEADLKLFRSTDAGNNWTLLASTVNISNHTVVANGITSLNGRYTLGNALALGVIEDANTKAAAKNTFSLLVFPNPFSDYIKLSIDSKEPLEIALYDAVGKMVFTKTVYSNKENILLGHLMPGIYYMQANNNRTQTTIKLIKQ